MVQSSTGRTVDQPSAHVLPSVLHIRTLAQLDKLTMADALPMWFSWDNRFILGGPWGGRMALISTGRIRRVDFLARGCGLPGPLRLVADGMATARHFDGPGRLSRAFI
ncbi:hypothetical protein POX_b02472 [Penicillium oxalicum]|uniref:hypothetical protein n=1 Tax=Penicillium oxalicum TaxID=69781 RepID=UPI0020B86DF2|nr:hypothetical protein POX_b02472 [Penicillium oxalicum]KAI2792434.1 hypothetical protein POX_b02472 [Penicillium oxalicum]